MVRAPITNNDMTTNTSKCPFHASPGYTTADGRAEYLLEHGSIATDDHESQSSSSSEQEQAANKAIGNSFQADLDPSKPLYFWQIYSLIGHEPIFELVQNFYQRIYADYDEPWFRNAFSDIASIDHHVQAQAMYWIDSFGGGKLYHGGQYRLNFHHYHNASHVMNQAGAKRWMHHMRGALMECCSNMDDPRILPCIVDFLKTKMKTYSKEHDWEFDDGDFDFGVKDSLVATASSTSYRVSPQSSLEQESDSANE